MTKTTAKTHTAMLKTVVTALATSTLLTALLFTVAGATVKTNVKSEASSISPGSDWYAAATVGGRCDETPTPRTVRHREPEGCTESTPDPR